MHAAPALSPAVSLPRRHSLPRRLILGSAFLLAIAVWAVPKMPTAAAQDARPAAALAAVAAPMVPPVPATPPVPPVPSASKPTDGTATFSVQIGDGPAAEAAADKAAADEAAPDAGAKGKRSVIVTKGGKSVTINGTIGEREYDSVGEFVHTEPGLAYMVIAIVALVFLSPVLAIALVVGYRIRKARMENETMLKLVEKGIVPPADAMAAATGARAWTPAASQAVEQVRDRRREAAWSDLRKGVVMSALGLAFTAYSLLDDRSPNVIGLVLLFVGLGYVVLWWFEDRQRAPRDRTAGPGDAR